MFAERSGLSAKVSTLTNKVAELEQELEKEKVTVSVIKELQGECIVSDIF